MTTYKQIEDIKKYTQNARQKAIDGYWIECKKNMVKAIAIIDKL